MVRPKLAYESAKIDVPDWSDFWSDYIRASKLGEARDQN